MNELFAVIDGLAKKYEDFLEEICNMESKTDDKEGVDAVCARLLQEGNRLGLVIHEKKFEKAGNVASLTYNPDGKLPMVCLSAHMDTVFKRGEWGYPPVRREDGKLIGPGVHDCKGGFAVSFLVMEALQKIGYTDRPVRLILQSEEEMQSVLSGKETIRFMTDEAKGAAAFFNLEGRKPGVVVTKRKGIIRLCLEVHGKAAHCGDYFDGRSAIREAAFKILQIEAMSVKDSITYNCGMIEGGTAMNVIPDICKVYIDVRVNDEDEYNNAIRVLQNIVSIPEVEGTKCELHIISDRKPMVRTEQNVRLYEHMRDVSMRYGFGELEQGASNGGSDAAYTTIAGIPSIDDFGTVGGSYHTKQEWCLLSSIAESAKIIAASIVDLPEDFK